MSQSHSDAPTLELNSTLGQFRLLSLLGEGGMGMVFQAEDLKLGRKVALKVMQPHIARQAHTRQRFLREAKVAAQIEHERIVRIYHVEEDRGVPFIAMELLKGESLDMFLRRERIPSLRVTFKVIMQTAQGLSVAHQKGMIHRGIKPSNIWMEPSEGKSGFRCKILDFGLARFVEADSISIQGGKSMGTPAYMSPEQWKGKEVDHRSDLFSLGAMFYQMLTGKLPFGSGAPLEIARAVALDEPTPPVNINPRIPVVLSELTMRLLAKSKHDRPMNAEEVIARLEAFAEQREPEESKWSSIQMAPSLEEIPDTLPHEMQRTPPSLRSSTRTAPRPHTPYPTEPLRQPNRSSGASKQLLIGAILTLLIIGLSISLYFLLNQKPKNETDPNAERLAQMQKELQEQKRRQEEEQNRRDDDERQRKERDAATEEELKRQSEALAKAKEQIERETRQRKEAEEALRKQRDQLKNDADALLNLEKQRQAKITTWLEEGKRAFEQREYDQAIDKFTQVIVEDSQNGEAFAYRAWAYNRSTRSVEARFDADDAVKFSPKSPFAYTIRAIVRDARADAALGIEDCNKALELDPKYALAYSRRGWLKAILKDKEPARQDANKGIELDPKSKWGYYFRAWVRNELADYDDAITDCQKVLALDPKSAEAYDELGFAYDRLREYRKAVEAYTKLIELRPKSSEAYRDRGSTYSQLGENDAAEEDFDKAIELDPKNARAYNSRGVFYEKQKFYTLALEDYTKAIEIDPNFEDAYLNRADVYEARDEEGDPARARADRQKAEEIRKK